MPAFCSSTGQASACVTRPFRNMTKVSWHLCHVKTCYGNMVGGENGCDHDNAEIGSKGRFPLSIGTLPTRRSPNHLSYRPRLGTKSLASHRLYQVDYAVIVYWIDFFYGLCISIVNMFATNYRSCQIYRSAKCTLYLHVICNKCSHPYVLERH